MTPRAERLAALQSAPFDVLVIGGGITGAATARDAASRGLRVALLEREDWASGTSWRSSKLIHGGLRYLATGEIHLVFESLSERTLLSALAPHLVQPAEFLFPAYRGHGTRPFLLSFGLTLYDLLALGRSPRRHRTLSRQEIVARERLLESPELLSGALYSDARTDDARLTLENVLDAASLGTTAVSQIEVQDFLKDRSGVTNGVRARDRESGRVFDIAARVVVNATGPWGDRLRQQDVPEATPSLRLSKGAHLTVPASRLPVQQPIASPAPDGRLLFAIPFDSVTLVGTTDTDFTGSPDDVAVDREDVESLLRAANETFPTAHLTPADIIATFAGLRPLLKQTGRNVQDTSREDAVTVSRSGLVTVCGGKLTTHRRMGARAIDRAAALLQQQDRPAAKSATRARPFPGAPEEPLALFLSDLARDAKSLGLDSETARHLGLRYGKRAEGVLALVAQDRSLSERVAPGLPDIAAEVVFAACREDARTIADVLIRRTHLFWQAPGQGTEALERTARLLARELAWDRAREKTSVEDYLSRIAESCNYR